MKTTLLKVTVITAGVSILALAALPVFADVDASVSEGASVGNFASTSGKFEGRDRRNGQNWIASTTPGHTSDKEKGKSDSEIDARINSLNKLLSRISDMSKVSESEKTSFSTNIQGQIHALTDLKTKVDNDSDADTLKADKQSITDSFRIYALVIPQGHLAAAADRITTIVNLLTTVAGKLQTRITTAQSAGHDMSASVSMLADLNAKITDANTQATAASGEVATLTPDNGDATIAAANKKVLLDASAKIKLAATDLKTARTDAGTIIKTLASFKISATTTATTTAQ